MSSEELVSSWIGENLKKIQSLLELSVQADVEISKAVLNYAHCNKNLAQFIFQLSPTISKKDRGKLIPLKLIEYSIYNLVFSLPLSRGHWKIDKRIFTQ